MIKRLALIILLFSSVNVFAGSGVYLSGVYVDRQYDFFVGMGQSNAKGSGDSAESPDVYRGLEIHSENFGVIYGMIENSVVDPVGQNDSPFERASSGSMWPSFCQQYFDETGREAIIMSLATSGSSQMAASDQGHGYWNGSMDAEAKTRIAYALDYLQGNGYLFTFRGFVWLQGESDAVAIKAGTTTEADYKAGLNAHINSFVDEYQGDWPSVKMFIIQIHLYPDYCPIGTAAVRNAQSEVCSENINAVLAYSNSYSFDAWHYNQTQYNAIGESVATTVYNYIKAE